MVTGASLWEQPDWKKKRKWEKLYDYLWMMCACMWIWMTGGKNAFIYPSRWLKAIHWVLPHRRTNSLWKRLIQIDSYESEVMSFVTLYTANKWNTTQIMLAKWPLFASCDHPGAWLCTIFVSVYSQNCVVSFHLLLHFAFRLPFTTVQSHSRIIDRACCGNEKLERNETVSWELSVGAFCAVSPRSLCRRLL